jgi:hypothetical protein
MDRSEQFSNRLKSQVEAQELVMDGEVSLGDGVSSVVMWKGRGWRDDVDSRKGR